MLINLRNALMAGKRLPYDAEVEYLESTGTQWIATGLGAGLTSSSIRIAATLKFTELSTGEHDLVGSGNAATPTMGRNGSNYFMWAKGGTTWYPTGCDTNWHKVSYTFNNPSGRVFELDGALYSGTQDNIFATGDGIHIFASGPNRYPLNCQLAKLEIWQNGVLVRDYIPVRVGTVGYLYDRVSGKLFGNAGSGDFVLGPDVVPVEYIESTGTQWIDTGVIGTDVGTLKMRLKKTDANGTRRFILNSARNPQPVGSSVYFDVNASGYFGQATNGYECIVGQWYDIEIVRDIGYYFDGTLRISTSLIFPFRSANNIQLFWVSNNNKFIGQISALKIYDNNDTPVRNFLPVRVGSGSTWEGAMIDTLTRRIYRNAGTGAFAYGNDLKYPIPAS